MNVHTELALQRKYRAESWKAWGEFFANLTLGIFYLAIAYSALRVVQKLMEL